MCRLFGMIAQTEIDQEFLDLMGALQQQAKEHPHGWGFAWYEGREVRTFKEASSAFQNPSFLKAARMVRSKLVITHIRKTNPESIALSNTHPFISGNWAFAHNGNIDIKERMREQLPWMSREKLEGSIDSEIFFHLILFSMRERRDPVDGIASAIEYVKSNRGGDTSALNFILADGRSMYAYRGAFRKEEHYSLHFLRRSDAMIISSDPLTGEEWKMIPNHNLLVVEDDLSTELVGM